MSLDSFLKNYLRIAINDTAGIRFLPQDPLELIKFIPTCWPRGSSRSRHQSLPSRDKMNQRKHKMSNNLFFYLNKQSIISAIMIKWNCGKSLREGKDREWTDVERSARRLSPHQFKTGGYSLFFFRTTTATPATPDGTNPWTSPRPSHSSSFWLSYIDRWTDIHQLFLIRKVQPLHNKNKDRAELRSASGVSRTQKFFL